MFFFTKPLLYFDVTVGVVAKLLAAALCNPGSITARNKYLHSLPGYIAGSCSESGVFVCDRRENPCVGWGSSLKKIYIDILIATQFAR